MEKKQPNKQQTSLHNTNPLPHYTEETELIWLQKPTSIGKKKIC